MVLRTEGKRRVAPSVLLLPLLLAAAPPDARGIAAVAADHAVASACGAEILARGGNAVDAAVATALCAGVVQPASSGLGGGGFAVVVLPDGEVEVLDFREVAPAGASRDMFLGPDGAPVPAWSQDGGLAVAVPTESVGLATLAARRGRLPLRDLAAPARRLAARGFVVEAHLASRLGSTRYAEVTSELSVGGRPAREGERVRRPSLAATLRRWAASEGADLHTGRGAAAIVAHVAAAGGVLAADDLAAAHATLRAPIEVRYRGWRVVTMPPPSSGGVVIGQALRVLEGFDVASMQPGGAPLLHLLAEVMQHAYADRAHHLGDPGFVEVPVGRLLGDGRVAEIRAAFDPARTWPVERYGPRIVAPADAGTEHLSVVDADGMAVALTTTINTTFGAGLVVPGTGVILNDQMDDFSAAPGVPNAYGLVGGEANAVAPGKVPLSSMAPTVLVGPEGQVLVVGASGGSTIPSGVLQAILAVVDFGMTPQEAVALPRVHHQWLPAVLHVEPEIGPETRAALAALGHELKVAPSITSVQAVLRTAEGQVLAGSDPRKGGRPAAVPAP